MADYPFPGIAQALAPGMTSGSEGLKAFWRSTANVGQQDTARVKSPG